MVEGGVTVAVDVGLMIRSSPMATVSATPGQGGQQIDLRRRSKRLLNIYAFCYRPYL